MELSDIAQNVVTLPSEFAPPGAHLSQRTMQQKTIRTTVRHWLRCCLTLLAEALVWWGCVYASSLMCGVRPSALPAAWLSTVGWGLAMLFVATWVVRNNAFSPTARRDEVVGCAMRTALLVGLLSFAFLGERSVRMAVACLLFFAGLAALRLVVNSLFVRSRLRRGEHGVILTDERSAWQQDVLQQNTYGLRLSRLEEPSARQLELYLAEHPSVQSVYLSPSCLAPTEQEDVAHLCRKQGLRLYVLPLSPESLPQNVRSECRGNVCVLSQAKPPLDDIACRTAKRLADIVLSLLVLLTVFPVFALIAYVFIKRQSRGPVLIVRQMCGMNGRPFRCITFRTRHYEAAPSFFQDTGDPGYFPFGKFLSASRLELMPQFLCVLWGSMSVVGSQTMRPERYGEYHRELNRLFASGSHVKAGLTSFRPASESQGSAKADVWYCRNWSFWLDLRIMLHRLAALIRSTKARSVSYI